MSAPLLFDLPPRPELPVAGGAGRFPVHRIFCVGRNYVEHAREMGVEVDREAPFYFTKSPSALAASGCTIPYPPGTEDFHHEVELVVAIGAPGFRLRPEEAARIVYGYACGLDMTRRDLQLAARVRQRPWDLGKDVEHSAVVGEITPAAVFGAIADQRIALARDGEVRQDARLSDLVWSVPEILAHLSGYYHLVPGDLVMTGTPAGVGPVRPGARLEGTIDGLAPVTLTIGDPQ